MLECEVFEEYFVQEDNQRKCFRNELIMGRDQPIGCASGPT